MKPLILASSSPRRKELLQQIGFQFSIRTSETDERLEPDWTPQDAVLHLSKRKQKLYFHCIQMQSLLVRIPSL